MLARLKAQLLALLAVVAGVVAYVWRLRDRQERLKTMEDYRETRERMDEAHVGDDPHAAERWLRERRDQRDL